MSQPIIEIHGIGKRYRIGTARARYLSLRDEIAKWLSPAARRARAAEEEFWALKDVSFAVEPGEAMGIIGRNGAGKSTLLKILSQITPPTAGKITCRGRIASLLEVGTGFHPELTGRENIYMNGAILGMGRKEIARKFDEIVAFAEMERFLDTPVKRYSSGMYVRLAFAVAAHLEPEILIVDEVLAVGDAQFQKKCIGRMGDVAKAGRTVLFVSHNMSAIERLCEKTVVLNKGRMEFCGPTSDGIRAYLAGRAQATVEWERPEPFPDFPHFRRATLINADGSPCAEPTSGGHFGVEIVYAVPSYTDGLIIASAVHNNFQTPLFSTTPSDCGVEVPSGPGIYKTKLIFPEALLMPKRFLVSMSLYLPGSGFDTQMPLEFDVTETKSLANSVPSGRIGDMQVTCDWSPSERLE